MLQGQQVGLTLASSQLSALPQREQVSVSPAGTAPSHRGPHPGPPGAVSPQGQKLAWGNLPYLFMGSVLLSKLAQVSLGVDQFPKGVM